MSEVKVLIAAIPAKDNAIYIYDYDKQHYLIEIKVPHTELLVVKRLFKQLVGTL